MERRRRLPSDERPPPRWCGRAASRGLAGLTGLALSRTAYKEPVLYNVRCSPVLTRSYPRLSLTLPILSHHIAFRTVWPVRTHDPYTLHPRSDPRQAAVARELAKQVYVAEKLAPPSFAQFSYTCA